MCLKTLPYGMVVIAGEVAVEDEDDDVGAVGVKGVGIPIVGDLGGLPEPGHLADSGPWLLIKPVAVVEKDRRHVAHTVLGGVILYISTATAPQRTARKC